MAKMYGRNGKKARRFSGRAKRHVRGHVGGRGNIRAQGRAKTRHYQYQGQAITVNQNPGGRSGSWVVGGVPNPGDPEVFRDPGNNWVIPIDYSLPPNDPECFVAGTKVTMKNGPDKNIEDIKVGDEILSYNVNTKQLEPKTVTKLFTQTHDLKDGDITVKVTFDNGTITHNTIANPFWSKDKGFVAVDEDRCNRVHAWVQETNSGNAVKSLDVNDTLFTLNDDSGELEEVKVSDIEYIMEEDIRTYDIQVEDNHTFFANGILTHNSGGSPGPTPTPTPTPPTRYCMDPIADNHGEACGSAANGCDSSLDLAGEPINCYQTVGNCVTNCCCNYFSFECGEDQCCHNNGLSNGCCPGEACFPCTSGTDFANCLP